MAERRHALATKATARRENRMLRLVWWDLSCFLAASLLFLLLAARSALALAEEMAEEAQAEAEAGAGAWGGARAAMAAAAHDGADELARRLLPAAQLSCRAEEQAELASSPPPWL